MGRLEVIVIILSFASGDGWLHDVINETALIYFIHK